MKKNGLTYAAALLAFVGGLWLTPQPASAQLGLGSLVVNITSPNSGATVSGTIPVSASVSIIGTLTVSRVEFFSDGNFIGSDSGAPYSVSWDTRTVGNGSHSLVAVGVDVLGVRWNSPSVTVTVSNDTTQPTVTINQAAGQADPASAAPINFTVVFSEAVSGFTGADVTIGGTAGGTKTRTVTGGPSTYNVAVSGMTTGGTVIATVGAGVATDAAGNGNTASTSTDNSVTWVPPDTTSPTVAINQAASQADPTTAAPINFTVVFSEAVSGFTGTDVTISGTAGGTKTRTVTGGPSTYNVAVSGMTTGGTVVATIGAGVATDAAGNGNTASTSTDNSVTWVPPDTTSPTVTINQAASQADPATAAPINFTAVFSEAVSGFTATDVTISGTAGGTKTVTVTGGPSTYNVAVSGMTSSGTVSATIAAGVAQDAAGNTNTASSSTDSTVQFNLPDTAPPLTRFEENHAAVSSGPAGAWAQQGQDVGSFSGGAAVSSNVTGAVASFTFTGKAVSLIALKCNVCGIATVSIDGGAPVTVDTAGPAGPNPKLKSETVFAASLADGTHTLTVTVTGTSTSGGSHIVVDAFDVAGSSASPIVVENLFPGSENWQMRRPGFQPADDVGKQIRGYASATSVNKGGSITFHVAVTPAQEYTMDVYRMGWYQGLGGRLLQRIGPLPGALQPACPVDAATGLIECAWAPGHTLTVPQTWTSGVYIVHLTNALGYQTYITFVVRDDARRADILYQQSVTTYQAYNNYPDDGATGKSLYDFNSYGANAGENTGSPRAVKVSWNRPYSGEGAGQFFAWEHNFVRWLERSGYDVTYSTNIDTHQNSARLLNSKAFLSVGHDEYWSKPMYDGVEQARDAGVSLGFFGADAVFWQVRFEPSPLTGAADRVMVGYKNRSLDPVQGPTTTVLWRDPFLNRPEQRLVGVQFSGQVNTNVPYVVTNSSSWVYEGTGLLDGHSIPGLVGYEVDTSMSGVPLPTSVAGTYQVLSQSPYTDVAGPQLVGNSSIYQAPSGAWVFGAGTISWSWGLDLPGVVHPGIQRTTANLLNRFLGIPSQPVPLQP